MSMTDLRNRRFADPVDQVGDRKVGTSVQAFWIVDKGHVRGSTRVGILDAHKVQEACRRGRYDLLQKLRILHASADGRWNMTPRQRPAELTARV